jgi:hypothetical protein
MPRRLPAMRGFFANPSLEGGLPLLELSWPNGRRNAATSSRSAAFYTRSAAFSDRSAAFSDRSAEFSARSAAISPRSVPISSTSPSIRALTSGDSAIPTSTHVRARRAIRIGSGQQKHPPTVAKPTHPRLGVTNMQHIGCELVEWERGFYRAVYKNSSHFG